MDLFCSVTSSPVAFSPKPILTTDVNHLHENSHDLKLDLEFILNQIADARTRLFHLTIGLLFICLRPFYTINTAISTNMAHSLQDAIARYVTLRADMK